jgi:hypothetical protein
LLLTSWLLAELVCWRAGTHELSCFRARSGVWSQAGARLCDCLGDEFIPFLPIVMPPLLKSAAMEAGIKVRAWREAGHTWGCFG